MLSESKFYMGYSRWSDVDNRYETWDESVERVMQMHRTKYKDKMTPELEGLIAFAEQAYKDKRVLGAQRALQFGGEQLFKHESRMYNCSVSHCDRPLFFQEAMYMLLCGCGVGFSVQEHHIAKLPKVTKPSNHVKIFVVPDSIEGWADAFGVLLSSYFVSNQPFPEYTGKTVHFDFSNIRPKGAMISGGFKAPGPDGLSDALRKCEKLLQGLTQDKQKTAVNISPIVAYDFVMHMSDAVLSGGVRRSATICLFSKTDKEMLNAKTGDWYVANPQRGRSNNSVMLLRNEVTREEWAEIMKSVKQVGEPGFIFTDNLEFCYNPCVEIGMLPALNGESGFQVCNLTESNGAMCNTKEDLMIACKAGSILGTLQAGYTNFRYLSEVSKKIIEREALIGVSITGWMNNPDVLFNEQNMIDGAEEVKYWNRVVADLIGINHAARTTCAKPSGNASVILGTGSGIHGEHSKLYIRNVQMNEQDDVLDLIRKTNPSMVENSVWSSGGTDYVVSFPVVTKDGSIYKSQLLGVKQLDYVKKAQQFWVEYGTNVDLCVDKNLRHNISNTITVDDWDEVEQYIFDNKQWFAGISLLSAMGDKAYAQAPFTEVFTADEILAKYGDAAMLASGLIVDGLQAFNQNLWVACDTVNGWGEKIESESKEHLLKRDWIRRANKFAANYFNNDKLEMTNCLKDCHNLHKWVTITRELKQLSFADELKEKSYVDANTLGGAACAGGSCEIVW